MKAIVASIAVLGAVLTVWGFLPDLHRSATSIALLRPVTGMMCLVALFAGAGRFRLALVSLGLIALGSVAVPLMPGKPGGDLRVYSKNLLHNNIGMAPIAEDIRTANADVVMLQEITDENSHILGQLGEAFPHQHICAYSGRIRIAVLSRLPMTDQRFCSGNRSTAGAQIVVNDVLVWAVSVHIPHPWPTDTAMTEAEVPRLLGALDGPIVIAGDFNAFPWTGRVQEIARVTGTRRAGPMRRTYIHAGLPLPIDHVLAPGGGTVETRPRLGSNHWGVLGDVALR